MPVKAAGQHWAQAGWPSELSQVMSWLGWPTCPRITNTKPMQVSRGLVDWVVIDLKSVGELKMKGVASIRSMAQPENSTLKKNRTLG